MNPNAPKLPSAPDIPLHDIKPLMEVPDSSLIWFSFVVAAGLVVIAAALYLLWRFLHRGKVESMRKLHFQLLHDVGFDDPKEAAYAITRYGQTFAQDAPRLEETYANLVERLAPYKYKKVVEPLDDETIAYYRIYVEMIDV